MKDHYKLPKEIVALSHSNEWDSAKLEWSLQTVYISDKGTNCLCGHPISEVCVLYNRINKRTAIVGNCCVKKFLELESNVVFTSIKRVISKESSSFNKEVIELAYANCIINEWDKNFYLDTYRKRRLSDRQLAKRQQINTKIVRHYNR